jgi:type II secretory pathway component GspD/PulD (secretin)
LTTLSLHIQESRFELAAGIGAGWALPRQKPLLTGTHRYIIEPLSGKGPVRSSSAIGEKTRAVKATVAWHRNPKSNRESSKIALPAMRGTPAASRLRREAQGGSTVNRGQWLAWWTSVGLVIGIVGSLTGQQADTVTRPAGATMRPAAALQEAINLYRKGEYEEAARLFELAQQGRQQLSPTEQQRLDEYRNRNEVARLGRQQTLQQLQAAQEAVKNGQWNEAENLLKQLRSSNYLKPEEQALVNQLSDRVARRNNRRWSLFNRESNGTRSDAESLLAQGREALKNNELDRAETLARQAKEAGYSAIFPWSDSPDKLLRDVQAARSRQQPDNAATAATPDADQLLAQAREAFRQGDLDRAEQLAQQAKQAGHSSWLPWSDTPDKVLRDVQQARRTQGQATQQQLKLQQARRLLSEAHQAVQQGDLPKARQLLAQAERLQVTLPPYEPHTPEKIRQAIAQAEQSQRAASNVSEPAKPAPSTNPSDAEPVTRQNARAKLKEARHLFEAGQLDQAESLARRIRVVPDCRWGLFEDTPDKLLADIYKARQEAHRQQADALLAQARRKLEQGQFDEAEKLAYQARALQPRYSIWHRGEHPDRLLAEIKARRQQANRPRIPNDTATANQQATPRPVEVSPAKQQAQMLLVQARAALQAGQLVQALQLARQARQYPVTWGADEDSPDKIEKAVEALLAQQRDRDQPEQAARLRQQALLLLADARELQRQGQVLPAIRRAREAQKLRAAFRPEDETPEQVLLDLQNQAHGHIETFSRAAHTWKQMGRYSEAEQCLKYVRTLQSELHLDTLQTDQQLAELQRLRQGAPVAQVPNQDEGQRLLEQARRELRAGELVRAQELARRVYTDHAHLRVEASQLLAEIDDAQYRQSVREANRFYELGVRAYSRGEYAQAAAYFQSINPRLLDERKRTHMQEILSSKEMQPHALVQAGQLPPTPETAPGQATATDRPKPATTSTDNLLDKVQQQREVELQRLRHIKLEAERQANRFAQNNELDKAVEVLQQALHEIKHSPLESEAVLAMQRQLEQRIRTFEASREQLAYDRLRQQTLRGSSPREREILADINRKEQVAQLMQQYSQYLKEAKYKEAEVVAMKAKELDPDNPATEAALIRARTLRALSDEERIKFQKERGFELAMQSVNEASVAPESDWQYPKDWAERNRRRNKAIQPIRPETPEDRDLYQRLQQPVSIDFRDKPLSEVLDHLRSLYGINIVPDEPALQAAGISLNQPVTIRLDNRPLRTCLNLILQNARLTWVVRDGVYIVTTEEGKRGKLVQKVYPVADLILPVQDFGNVGNNSASILSVIQQNMNNQQPALTAPWTLPGGTTVGQGSMAGSTSPGQAQVKVEPPKTASLEQTLIRLIHETIEPKSWDVAGGPGHIDYYPLGMQLVVSADPEIQEQVEQLLTRLRELQELQVTVEVRFITLSEAFYERIGIDFNFQVDDDQTRFDRMVVAQSFAPPGMINEPDHLDKVVVGLAPTGAGFSQDLDIPFTNSSFSRAIPPFGNFPNAVGNNGGLSFGFAYLSDIEVFLFMEAAQGDTRANVMQAPKITLFSGQTANLTVQDIQFLVTGALPLIGPFGQVTLVPQVQPFPTGLQLFLQAVVHSDRRYVRLSLAPTFTALAQNIPLFPIQINVPVVNPDGSISQVQLTQFIQLPIESILSVQTTVMVPDGGTVLMGGFKTLSEGRTEFGPPILSKIPYLNRLFTNTAYGREARSLMIMITPRIIIPEEEEQFLGQQLLPP